MIPTVKAQGEVTRGARTCAIGLALLGALPLMGGCRGDRTDKPPRQFFPDMDDQPKLKPQSETQFFADGRSQRLPVEGTVPFGAHDVQPGAGDDSDWARMRVKDRADMLQDDETYYFGLVAGSAGSETPRYAQRMPVTVNRELIERGAERFNIYCSACHGYDALGNDSGSVGRLMNVRPVNLLDAKYRDRAGEFGSDGYLFHVIREGLWSPDGANRMPAYGHAVDEHDAWAIVAYIRVLQAAFDAEGDATVSGDNATTSNDGGEG